MNPLSYWLHQPNVSFLPCLPYLAWLYCQMLTSPVEEIASK